MCKTQSRAERSAKELIVGRPHKWVIDDRGAFQDRVFQVAAVVWHFVRDAIYQDAVGHAFVHSRAAKTRELRNNTSLAAIHFVDEPRRKRPLTANDHANSFHVIGPSLIGH